MISKLQENFKKIGNSYSDREHLERLIDELLQANVNNEPLQMYIKLTKALDDAKKIPDNKDNKDSLYEDMILEGIDFLEDNNCTVTLTKPYMKKDIDKKKLEKVYPLAYNDCLTEKEVKGHVTIKRKLEE